MKKSLAVVATLTLSASLFIASCSRSAVPNIEIDGNVVKITAGTHHLTAEKKADLSEKGMLFGCDSYPKQNTYFTGSMSYITMSRVEELKAKYPDFYQCASPGASEAKGSVITVVLIPGNSKVENKIRQMAGVYAKLDKRVVAEFKGIQIAITEYKVKEGGEEGVIPLQNITPMPHYLIEELDYAEMDK
ncbi:MAG TPA: hypothetical protein VJC37_03550 [Planctomycetota bacterium]|nr:hypothetical protein [Planctomycetota bacterium]